MAQQPPPVSPWRLMVGLFVLFLLATGLLLYDIAVCITSPIFLINPRLAYDVNSQMIEWIWAPLQYLFLELRSAEISFSGDYHMIPQGENAFVLSNHQSWTDFYAIHTLAQRKGMLRRCRYFAKSSLRYIPFFGWALVLGGMLIVERNWMKDHVKLEKTFAKMKERKWPIWLTMFAEGTRIKPKVLQRSQEFCRSKGLPVFENVLFPRHKGFDACIQSLRTSHIQHVYDITIAYYPTTEIPPTLYQIFCLPNISPYYKFHVHVRRYEMKDLPDTTEGLNQWLTDRWTEKDEYLGKLKKMGWEARR